MTTDNPQQIVFIDSRVPDIQDLIAGVQPGVQMFVLDPTSDGMQQIADILAANNFTDLSSISIVSHGDAGEVMLGTTTLSDSNLASYSRPLAEIGASLAPGGDIQLYGCDVALGSTGQRFIDDFSTLTGSANVEAATHIVGSAAFGGSWTLDAASDNWAANFADPAAGAPGGGKDGPGGSPLGGGTDGGGGVEPAASTSVASPFTSQALANFQGQLVAPPDGQLWFVTDGGDVDTRLEFVNSNGTSQTTEISDATANPLGAFPADVVFDPGAGLYFMTETGAQPDQGYGGNVLEGTLYSAATPSTVYSVSTSVTTVSGVTHGLFGEQLAIDTTQHVVYLGIGGSNEPTNEGILRLAYDPHTGSVTNNGFLITASQTGINGPFGVFDIRDMALDTANHEIYFVSMVPNPAAAQNQIYAVDIDNPTTVTTLFSQSDFPTNFSNGYILAVTVDAAHGEVYFATESQHPDATSTLNAIWEVSVTGGTPVRLANYPTGTYPNDLAFDPSSRQLIVNDEQNDDLLFLQLNSTGLSVTGTTTVALSFTHGSGSTAEGLAFDALPTLSGLVGTAVVPTEEHGAVTLASGIAITDPDSPSLASATVFFGSGSFAGASDVLGADTAGTGISASYNTATETLTLTGQDSFGHYAQVLDSVTFTAGENPTDYGSTPTRVIDWVVSDGLQDVAFGASNSASSTISVVFVNDPPTLSSVAGSVQFTEEGGAVTLSHTLSVTDPDDLNLSSATVSITGGRFTNDGDILGFNTASTSVTASYNSSTETLTLSGTDTLAHYQQVLDSVTFNDGENPTNYGSNLTRTITWLATDPSGTLNGGVSISTLSTTTVTLTNVNDPPTLALGTTVASWTEEGALATLSPTVTITDPDNLDLVSATVAVTGGTFTGDADQLSVDGIVGAGTIFTTNGTLAVSYNSTSETLTFTGTDTLADYQSVLDAVAFNAGENPTDFGSDPTRTLTWTLNDGSGTANSGSEIGTATSTVSITNVNDPPTLSGLTNAQFTEEGGAVTLSGALSVTDPDDVNLSSATVSISGGTFAGDGDILGFNTAGTSITATYTNGTSGEFLTLSGTDTLLHYQDVLRSVTFNDGENPTNYGSNPTRTITWLAMDPSGTSLGGSATSTLSTTTVTLTNVNDPPTLALGTTVASWTEEGAVATLAPTVTVTDPDNLDLVSATVSIGGFFAGDTLSFTNSNNITGSYNSSTGILTFTGSDTLAHYGTVLESVQFNGGENPTDFGSDLTRTVTWVLNDGGASNALSTAQTTTVSITNVNDPPTLANVPGTAAATATAQTTITLAPNVTVTDPDNLDLVNATVSITGGTFAGDGDVLAATGTTSITVSYNSNTETLTLSGTDTLPHYQAVLDSVTFDPNVTDPTNSGANPTRTVTWVLNDGGTSNNLSTAQTETVTVAQADIPPTLTGVAANAFWTEEVAPTTLSNHITISDGDAVNTELSATVSITGGTFANDHDTLSATPTGNITVSYNSSTETLTLAGSDSLANYQTVLDSVAFNAGENPTDFGSNPTRTIAWTVADHLGTESAPQTTTVTVVNVNDPPTLGNVATSQSYTEEGGPVTLSSAVSVSDPDDLDLASATVAITGGTFANDGDTLSATPTGNITVSYNSSTETLTLTGSDSLANYQTVLDTVTFSARPENPNNFGSNPTRTVTWTLNDGSGSNNLSTAVTSTISISNVNDAPTLGNVATSQNFTEEAGAVTLSSAVSVSDPDDLDLASATVSIAGGTFANDHDVLAATATASITVSYNSTTETLTLTGSDTLAHYQAVLDTVTFNAGENPNDFGSNPTRTVTWTLNDGSGSNNLSTAVTSTISISNVNDPPTLSNVATTQNYTEESPSVTLSSGVSVSDPDDLDLASATVSIAGGTFAGDGDVLAATGTASIAVSYNSTTETLTLTGSDTLAHYQAVLDTVTFSARPENPNDFGSNPTRTVTWTLNDGSGSNNLSTAVTSTISVSNVNDAPTLSNVATSQSYTEEGPAATLSSAVSVSDPDDVNLSAATIRITGGTFANDQDVLAATTTGTSITASYNSTTETLTLSGADTLAHYQTVLDSVTFNAGENPNDFGSNPTRTLTWVLMDPSGTANGGVNVSTPVTTTVSVTNINDPPTLSNVATSARVTSLGQTITVSPSTSASDPDDLDLVSATVAITGGTFSGDGDVLAATTTGTSIAASYNSTTETLTLTGSDTLAHYSQVLDSVTFDSTSGNPTNSGADQTRTVTWVLNDGSGSNNLSAPATTTISFQRGVPFDFNGDGISDLLFQDEGFNAGPNFGTPQVWLWNGTSVTSEVTLVNPGGSWHVVAAGDFNHNLLADIVLQNTDGLPQIWLMNGTSVTSTVTLPDPGPSWHVIATGDFNGDGNADILWQNTDGLPAIWEFNGTNIIAAAVLPDPGPTWRAIGTGDFLGNGHSDILWQNTDGLPAIWEMNGTSIVGSGVLPNPGPAWHAVATGDFFGNGRADILWQNTDGLPAIWEMNGTSIVNTAVLPNPGNSWHAIGTGDFLGNGRFDIVWQNTDGLPAIWMMNGFSTTSTAVLPNPGLGWQLEDDGPIPAGQMGTPGSPAQPPGPSLHASTPDGLNGNPSQPPAFGPPNFALAAGFGSLLNPGPDPTRTHVPLFSSG